MSTAMGGRPLRWRPLGEAHLSHRATWWMRRVAQVVGFGALVMFAVMAYHVGVPQSTYFDVWERPAQIGLLAAASLGYLLALRWPGLGGAIMMQTAVGLGVLASIQYDWLTSLVACLAFFVPGMLFVLAWQRTQTAPAIAAVFVAVAAMLVVGWYASDQVYAYYFGPTHPESALEKQPVDLVEWIWSGGVTDSQATVNARLHEEHANVELLVSTSADLSDPVRVGPVAASKDNERVVSLAVDGLQPDTEYHYAIEADGEVEATRHGTFRTFPAGPASFSFAFSSCARTGSNGSVFDAIREDSPLLYLVTGDFNYENISSNDPGAFRDAYQRTLTSPAQAALYQSAPIAYVWDDHDYGGNNSDSQSASRPAARSMYQQIVPHYETPAGGDGAIYQAFSVGRVRLIITDSRSERSPSSLPDDAQKTMLGKAQKTWFKDEMLAARDAALIVWVNADPWIGEAQAGGDSWDGYDTERQELASFITDNGIENILMVSGDAHMIAIDDGTNSAGGFPVFHAAALDRRGRVKGGPYSEGTYPDGGQFGLVTVNDTGGDQVEVILSGRNYKNEEVVGYSFTVDVSAGE